jgi:tRNA U34 5-methylaminomethyl-2-thiouridine-forming methyltransferase MnmC
LVYFDVFGYRVQPELWQPEILEKAYQALLKNGIFVTYSAKGQLKRDLKAIGFKVETLPGPPGKREMIRAIKI